MICIGKYIGKNISILISTKINIIDFKKIPSNKKKDISNVDDLTQG